MIQFVKRNSDEPLVGVEIGVYKGENAYNIFKTLNIDALYLIDPYTQRPLDYAKAKKTIRGLGLAIFKIATSEDAAKRIPNNLDFVYIDGNHEYEYVKKDIEIYYPKVKSGGVIGGHDFCGSNIGVCIAAIEFSQKNNLTLFGWDKDWWIIREE